MCICVCYVATVNEVEMSMRSKESIEKECLISSGLWVKVMHIIGIDCTTDNGI